MKVNFDHRDQVQNQDPQELRSQMAKKAVKGQGNTGASGIFSVQIDGKQDAYGVIREKEQKGSFSDLMEGDLMDGGSLQKKYMAVMSNSMSSEDFGNLMKEGYDPANVEIEDAVTILDTIKIAVAKGGTAIVGFTDTLDQDTLQQALGSEGMARSLGAKLADPTAAHPEGNGKPYQDITTAEFQQAMELATSLSEPSREEALYLVGNGLPPTVRNLYLARYSAAGTEVSGNAGYYAEQGGYYTKAGELSDMTGLEEQIRNVLQNAGMEGTDEEYAMAENLIKAGIPLTEDALWRYEEIRSVELPSTEAAWRKKLADTMASGMSPMDTDLSLRENVYERALRIQKETDSILDETVRAAEKKEIPITIRSLSFLQKNLDAAAEGYGLTGDKDPEQAGELRNTGSGSEASGAQKVLANIRMKMTVDANVMLLRRGIRLDTEPLRAVLDQLEQLEKAETEAGTPLRRSEIRQASEQSKALRGMGALPVQVIGSAVSGRISFTGSELIREGKQLQARLETAGEKYETCMTAPRRDLGDSIKKAFGNISELLQEAGVEETEETRRAVRILGYSKMEVSRENIRLMLEADEKVQQVIHRITPSAALALIRNKKNPLEMDLGELSEYLKEREKEPEQDLEKYGRFLYRLEKNGQIGENEKEAYIGIFRMLRQIEKTDGAAIGQLVRSGAELNFQNLMTALRTQRRGGMDYRIDNSFGGIETARREETLTITEQICKMNAERLYDQASPALFQKLHLTENSILTETSEYEASADPSGEEAAAAEEQAADRLMDQVLLGRMKESMRQEEAQRLLSGDGRSLSLQELMAASGMEKGIRDLQKRLTEGQSGEVRERLWEKTEGFLEALEDEERAGDSYDALMAEYEEAALSETEQEVPTSGSVRRAFELYRQIRLARQLSAQENYEIPMESDGEYTSVNLKLIHGTGKEQLFIVTDLSEYGRIGMKVEVGEDDSYQGFLLAQNYAGEDLLKSVRETLTKTFEQMGLPGMELPVIRSRQIESPLMTASEERITEDPSGRKKRSGNFYRMAKAFLQSIRKV